MATHVRLHDQVKRRIAAGASAESDLALAIARLKAVDADSAAARNQSDIAVTRLSQLVGREVNAATLLNTVATPLPVLGSANSLVGLARAASPTLMKAQAQADAQKAVIAERRADYSPEVYVRAERQYGSQPLNPSASQNRVFIGFATRFGAGLSTVSNVNGAASQHQAAIEEIDVQSRALTEQVLADYALAKASTTRFDVLQFSSSAASQVADSYDRQFLAGRKTWNDVMNAARELAQTEVQLADLKSSMVVLSWRLAIYTQDLSSLLKGSL
jgi:adhesin transport system outer membrane protein